MLQNKDSFVSFYEVLQHLQMTIPREKQVLLSRFFKSLEEEVTKSYEGMSRICRRIRFTEAMAVIHCFPDKQRHNKNTANH